MAGDNEFSTAVEDAIPSSSNHQIFHIKDLSTATVTLYPNKARITRNISNVALRSGTNEVEIYGLSPTVDEQSIQIEGQGNATIVDMTVQLVPNRDILAEQYPEESEDEEESEESESDEEDARITEIDDETKKLKILVKQATEDQNSANDRLATLDRYAKSATAEHLAPDAISTLLEKYAADRKSIFTAHTKATQDLDALKEKIKKLEKEKAKVGKGAKKQKQKKEKQKAKEQRKKMLKRAEKAKHARYTRLERLRYWPKKVYRVTLTLEPDSTLDTPASPRRGSLDSITLSESCRISSPKPLLSKNYDVDSTASTQTTVSLLLTYVTREASWAPRYDLQISSVQKTATIIYRTEFLNRTSETWKDAHVSFSTSQTSYQGLDDTVPRMHPWRVQLDKDRGVGVDGGLLSTEEMYKPRFSSRGSSDFFNRAELFGLDDNYVPVQAQRYLQAQQKPGFAKHGMAPPNGDRSTGLFGSAVGNNPGVPSVNGRALFPGNAATNTAPVGRSSPFGGHASANTTFSFGVTTTVPTAPTGGSLFGGTAPAPVAPAASSLFGRTAAAPSSGLSGQTNVQSQRVAPLPDEGTADIPTREAQEHTAPVLQAQATLFPPAPLDFDEASWEDNGLTATYDCPRPLTLPPSSLTRRHKIASLHASNITLSHISVPKLRSAAFLRAKIRNPSSSITLLKGSAGVTLDGSFLGNMTIPRVSPQQTFDLSLGVDPAVTISYPKPTVKRSTLGVLFAKETSQVYERSIWITNTKSSPIDLLVLDQVPVSEYERLRITILKPGGLAKEGDRVKAGQDAKGSGKEKADGKGKEVEWGSAVAELKKDGEVAWTVRVRAQRACLLRLEYEARLPPMESIVSAETAFFGSGR